MHAAVQCAIERKVDLFEFGGDAFDPDSGVCVFRCVKLLLDAAHSLSRADIRSVWLAGNHDVLEDGSGDTTLTPLYALQAGGMPVRVLDQPAWVQLRGGLDMLALPYTATSHTYDPEKFVRDTWRSEHQRVVVATHLGIEGVQPGEETKDLPRGRDVLYPKKLIATKGTRVAAQIAHHYHRRQQHEGIQIVGAPANFAFGEAQNEPGFIVFELEV
jgi:DNA repair exonuclease SbcCD nuclease subunit